MFIDQLPSSKYMLTLNLLGSPQILWHGEPVSKLTSAKSQALLYFLAMSPRPHTRLELGGLLWPDKSDDEARTNLRQSIMLVRKPLSKEVFDTQRESIQFNPNLPVEIDVFSFLNRAERFFKDGEALEDHLDELMIAADTYHGPFLEGFFVEDANRFDEWMLVERERLHQMAIDLFSRLVDYFTARRETARGLLYARRLVMLEPLREESYQQLMKLLAWEGDIGGALVQYKACQEMLAREFGLSPSAETELIFQRIQRLRQARPLELPAGFLPMVNRERELADVSQLLHHPTRRLVTLMGLGGVGKTRTALAVAEQEQRLFLDGVFWVDLADSETAEDIVYAIAGEVECRFSGSVSPIKQLIQFLRQKEILLILDNFEQLMQEKDSPRLIGQLLKGTVELKLLITSRIRLNLREEQVYRLSHFEIPDLALGIKSSVENHALQLFTQGARQVLPDWDPQPELEAVTRICELVEGLPLGLEMAAALTESQSCRSIANALESGIGELELESLDMPERHQSLRATFNYSYELLDQDDQQLLARLSIFRGTFSAEAAQEIAGASIKDLSRLITRSLIRFEPPARYALHSTIRSLAAEYFDDKEGEISGRFRDHYLNMLADQESALASPNAKVSTRVLTSAYENIRHAWVSAHEAGQDLLIQRASQSLESYLGLRGLYLEGVKLFGGAGVSKLDPGFVARLQVQQAHFMVRLSRYGEMIQIMRETINRFPDDPWVQVKGRAYWADALWRQGKYQLAEEISKVGLEFAQTHQLDEPTAHSLFNLGVIADLTGRYDDAIEYFNRAMTLYEHVGAMRRVVTIKNSLAIVAFNQEELGIARDHLESAIEMSCQMGDVDTEQVALNNLGLILIEEEKFEEALKNLTRSVELATRAGQQTNQGKGLMVTARTYFYMGEYEEARKRLIPSILILEEIQEMPALVTALGLLAKIEAYLGYTLQTDAYFERAVSICEEHGMDLELAETYLTWAEVMAALNRVEDSQHFANQAKEIAVKIGHEPIVRAIENLK